MSPADHTHQRVGLRDLLVVFLVVGLAFVASTSIVAIPTMPALGGVLFFGSCMGLTAFSATFGAAA